MFSKKTAQQQCVDHTIYPSVKLKDDFFKNEQVLARYTAPAYAFVFKIDPLSQYKKFLTKE